MRIPVSVPTKSIPSRRKVYYELKMEGLPEKGLLLSPVVVVLVWSVDRQVSPNCKWYAKSPCTERPAYHVRNEDASGKILSPPRRASGMSWDTPLSDTGGLFLDPRVGPKCRKGFWCSVITLFDPNPTPTT